MLGKKRLLGLLALLAILIALPIAIFLASNPKPQETRSKAAEPNSVPFLGRTPSGPVYIIGQSNVTISGKQFTNLTTGAVYIENSSNITITDNDFSNVKHAILAIGSRNVTITRNRFRSVGDLEAGAIIGRMGNFVQFNGVTGGRIADNKGVGGNTEDMISIYKSGGSSAGSPLIIENNAFESPLPPDPIAWVSPSGSGIMAGDDGGHDIVVRNNTLLNAGQVGVGVASGTNIHITGNTIYGVKRRDSHFGIAVKNFYSVCNGIEVANNKVNWINESGSSKGFLNGGDCGTISGESTNNWNAQIDPSSLKVDLNVTSTAPVPKPRCNTVVNPERSCGSCENGTKSCYLDYYKNANIESNACDAFFQNYSSDSQGNIGSRPQCNTLVQPERLCQACVNGTRSCIIALYTSPSGTTSEACDDVKRDLSCSFSGGVVPTINPTKTPSLTPAPTHTATPKPTSTSLTPTSAPPPPAGSRPKCNTVADPAKFCKACVNGRRTCTLALYTYSDGKTTDACDDVESSESCGTTQTPADINQDGTLNLLDFNILRKCWVTPDQLAGCKPGEDIFKKADLNSDGRIDDIDYTIFLKELSTQAR